MSEQHNKVIGHLLNVHGPEDVRTIPHWIRLEYKSNLINHKNMNIENCLKKEKNRLKYVLAKI